MYKIQLDKNINDKNTKPVDINILRWNDMIEAGEWLIKHIEENHSYTYSRETNHLLFNEGKKRKGITLFDMNDESEIFRTGDENLMIDNKEYIISKIEEK